MRKRLRRKKISYMSGEEKIYSGKKELFRFSDDITQETIEYILGNIEKVLNKQDLNKALHRKVFYLMVEALQNVYNHTCKSGPKSCKPTVVLYVFDNDFFIETSNLVPNKEILEIETKLESINKLNSEQLKLRYKIIKEGSIYLTSCIFKNERFLRVVIINPDTSKKDFEKLIQVIIKLGDKL